MDSEKQLDSYIKYLENHFTNCKGYVGKDAIKSFVNMIACDGFIGEFLLSSFLLDENVGSVYELLALELSVEIRDNFVGIEKMPITGSYLDDDHTKNLDRKVIVGSGNYELLIAYMDNFLANVDYIANEERKMFIDRPMYHSLRDATVWFQLY